MEVETFCVFFFFMYGMYLAAHLFYGYVTSSNQYEFLFKIEVSATGPTPWYTAQKGYEVAKYKPCKFF